MKWIDRLVRLVLCCCIAALGGYIILHAVAIAGENGVFQNSPLLSAVYGKIEEWTAGAYLPVLSYVPKEEWQGADELLKEAFDETYPLATFLKRRESQKRAVESSSEYELIVRAEAQAEEHKQPRDLDAWIGAKEPSGNTDGGEELSYEQLLNRYFAMDMTTTIDSGRLDGRKLLGMDLTLQKNGAVPQILIYHTHSQEAFADSVQGDDSTTIVGVGDYLTKVLSEQYGYQVIHERGVFDLVDGVLDRNLAYDLAEQRVREILQEHPSIEVVIDLHRDGVDGTRFVTEYEGRPAAKLMFIVGMSRTADGQDISYLPNPYIEENLAFALQMQMAAEQMQPELMRHIYLMAYRFNMHVRPRSILLEAGTQLSTVAEEKTAMEAFAKLLDKVLRGV